jgi:hypothetical protein
MQTGRVKLTKLCANLSSDSTVKRMKQESLINFGGIKKFTLRIDVNLPNSYKVQQVGYTFVQNAIVTSL